MKRLKFTAKVGSETLHPKGFYYQGKYVILVGCTINNHTIRRKEIIGDVDIKIEEEGD